MMLFSDPKKASIGTSFYCATESRISSDNDSIGVSSTIASALQSADSIGQPTLKKRFFTLY